MMLPIHPGNIQYDLSLSSDIQSAVFASVQFSIVSLLYWDVNIQGNWLTFLMALYFSTNSHLAQCSENFFEKILFTTSLVWFNRNEKYWTHTHNICLCFGRYCWAAVEHNDVILTLGLHTTGSVAHTPISHVSLFIDIICIFKLY